MPDYRGETAVLFLPGRFLGLEKEDAVHGQGHGQRKECRRSRTNRPAGKHIPRHQTSSVFSMSCLINDRTPGSERFFAGQGKFLQAGCRPARKFNAERRKKIRCLGVLTFFKQGLINVRKQFGSNGIGQIFGQEKISPLTTLLV